MFVVLQENGNRHYAAFHKHGQVFRMPCMYV